MQAAGPAPTGFQAADPKLGEVVAASDHYWQLSHLAHSASYFDLKNWVAS